MNKEIEKEILEEIQKNDLTDFAKYIGIDDEDIGYLYHEIEMDDYSK